MLSNFGWGEIFVIVLLGVVIIGPERLPAVIQDVRAAIFAARKAINNAKAELNGEMGDFTKEFEDLRGPISQAAEWGRLGPRGVITKALFDGDDSAWDDFDPRKAPRREAGQQPGTQSHQQPQIPAQGQQYSTQPYPQQTQAPGQQRASFDYSTYYAEPVQQSTQPPAQQPQQQHNPPQPESQGGQWSDVT